jgi:hypothetical protein
MSHGTVISQQARYRARCTGNAYQSEQQFLSSNRYAEPIPTARGPQARLEAALFDRLDGDFALSAHPVGISVVTPLADHLAVALDPVLVTHLGPTPLGAHSLAMLLPTVGGSLDEPGGIPGLRLKAIDDVGLHLTDVGGGASAVLTGPSAAEWHTYLAAHLDWCRSYHLEPAWTDPELAADEVRYRITPHHRRDVLEEGAWLSSGLLRRIGLLHTVTDLYNADYWFSDHTWKFELEYAFGVPVNHDVLVQHLTHPRWGLPLKIARVHCDCPTCPCPSEQRDRMCWIELAALDGVGPGMQLRVISHGPGHDLAEDHQQLAAAGASLPWLRRVMPRKHRQLGGGQQHDLVLPVR